MTTFSVVNGSSVGASGLTNTQISLVRDGILGAASLINQHLPDVPVDIEIRLEFEKLGNALATGGTFFTFSGTEGPGQEVWDLASLEELISGQDTAPDGDTTDIIFTVDLDFLRNGEFFFDPNPASRATPVPSTQYDFTTIAIHEILHGLGVLAIVGGEPSHVDTPGPDVTPFDDNVDFINGQRFFTGANAVAANGGQPILLESGTSAHIESAAEGGIDSILNATIGTGERQYITVIELAILQDLGLSLSTINPTKATPTPITTLNAAPVARNDNVSTDAASVIEISVLANDMDADGDPLTASVETGPSNGNAVVNANGTISYTPDAGFVGGDSFTYTVSDGNGGSDTAIARIIVNPLSTATDLLGTANRDRLVGTSADETFQGFAGRDTVVFSSELASTSVEIMDGSVMTTGADGTDMLISVERLEFSDGTLLFDLEGDMLSYVYRVYSAAFARTPDEAGLRFWNEQAGSGNFSQDEIAEIFVESDEFGSKFGSDPTNDQFINALYNNVLLRDADEAGFTFWNGVFATEGQGRDDMLVYFAESDENVARNEDNLDDGVFVL